MKMPSKEFLLQEEGYADDDWDITDGAQKAYKAAKLKGWNLDKIRVHFCAVTTEKRWQESVDATKQCSKGSADQLSTVMDIIGRRDPAEQASGSQDQPTAEDVAFEKFQNQLAVFSTQKSIWASILILGWFQFCLILFYFVNPGAVEKDISKITGVRLQNRPDPALKQKAKDLAAFLKDQNEYMEQATQYLGAAEEARKDEVNQAYLEVLQNHSEKMGELHAAVKDELRRATALL